VRCPSCASLDDKVVDSRLAEDGATIRRRRECLACGRRVTTFERVEEVPLTVLKRSGGREPFDRAKVAAGIRAAAKNRPLSPAQIAEASTEIEEALRLEGAEVASSRIGVVVLERLRALDEVAYLRFASVYKDFDDPSDFGRELELLAKRDDGPPPG
jgi:transcriptional repressor NrdR